MKRTNLEDLFVWSIYQPDRWIDFNGFYWRRDRGGVLIDPMPLTDERRAWLAEQPGSVRWIVLTNADHLRAAVELKEQFGALIVAPEHDALTATVDVRFGEEAPLPDDLGTSIDVHWLRGGKTAAEAALYLRPLRALLFGDAVRSHDSGVLRLLPDEKLADKSALVRDIVALGELELDAVLLGDGDCLFTGAEDAFRALLQSIG